MNYHYPGNIRELGNILEHAFVLCHGSVIQLAHLPPEIQRGIPESNHPPLSFGKRLKEQEGGADSNKSWINVRAIEPWPQMN